MSERPDDLFHIPATWDENDNAIEGKSWLTKCGQQRPPFTEERPSGFRDEQSCQTCFDGWYGKADR